MAKMPQLDGHSIVAALMKSGWIVQSGKGSHVTLTRPGQTSHVTVPLHGKRSIPAGTPQNIMRQTGLSREDFIAPFG